MCRRMRNQCRFNSRSKNNFRNFRKKETMSGTHLHCADACDDVRRSVVFYLPFYTFRKKMVGASLRVPSWVSFFFSFFSVACLLTGEEGTNQQKKKKKKINFPSRTAFSFLWTHFITWSSSTLILHPVFLSNNSCLSIHDASQQNSPFCLKKKRRRGRWAMACLHIFFT